MEKYEFIFYIVTLAICVGAYVVCIKKFDCDVKRKTLVNVIMVITVFLLYAFGVVRMYIKEGPHDWNFLNTLPVANVSPFTFCLALVALVLPKKLKNVVFTLVSLLSLGMVVAGSLICFSYVLRQYSFHFTIAADVLAHFVLSFFGVYLVKSGQVEPDKKNTIVAGATIVCVAVVMMALNIVFGTAFFGLGFNGNHNIYNMVLFDNAVVSATAYFLGLIGVLALGRAYWCALTRK